jgi:NitT/TauT family transport system substrate-binding protein
MKTLVRLIIGLVLAFRLAVPAQAEVSEIRITKQPGLVYLPLTIMEANHLLEKHARLRGLGDIKVTWIVFTSGATAVDALLSGNVDLVTSGGTNMLVAWSASNGRVKGVAGAGAIPMLLVTSNPNVKTIRDFTAADKIALPSLKVSVQATILRMEVARLFGDSQVAKLDPLTVAMGHPDAYIALKSGKGSVDSHFSLPPYWEQELKIPGVHSVLSSLDVAGGPVSNGVVFGTTEFHDANPKLMQAFLAAQAEAIDLIHKNPKAAAQIYLADSKEPWSVAEITAMLTDVNFVYALAPKQSMKLHDSMYKSGVIKKPATSWKDYFFPEVHNLSGS